MDAMLAVSFENQQYHERSKISDIAKTMGAQSTILQLYLQAIKIVMRTERQEIYLRKINATFAPPKAK